MDDFNRIHFGKYLKQFDPEVAFDEFLKSEENAGRKSSIAHQARNDLASLPEKPSRQNVDAFKTALSELPEATPFMRKLVTEYTDAEVRTLIEYGIKTQKGKHLRKLQNLLINYFLYSRYEQGQPLDTIKKTLEKALQPFIQKTAKVFVQNRTVRNALQELTEQLLS
jgi:membrane carboxypeptidase/penicillin-binding protein PbpC